MNSIWLIIFTIVGVTSGNLLDDLTAFQTIISLPITRKEHCDWTEMATYILHLNALVGNKTYLEFSEQQLLDCVSPTVVCAYGDFIKALDYVKQRGISTKCGYPNRQLAKRTCNNSTFVYNFTFTQIKNSNEEQMLQMIQEHGPVIAKVNLDNLWNYTRHDIIAFDNFNRTATGEVAVLGAGVLMNQPIWLVAIASIDGYPQRFLKIQRGYNISGLGTSYRFAVLKHTNRVNDLL